MPKYTFRLKDGGDKNVGTIELPDVRAARIQAIRFGAELLQDDPNLIWDGRDLRVLVSDASGNLCVTVITLAIDATDVN